MYRYDILYKYTVHQTPGFLHVLLTSYHIRRNPNNSIYSEHAENASRSDTEQYNRQQ